MMTRLRTLILAVIAATALWSGLVYAAPPESGSGPSKEMMEKMDAKRDQLYTELNLSEEQKKALEGNKNKHREESKALFENMKAKRDLMREELQKDTLDMGKINQLQNDLKQSQSQMSDQRLQGILEVRKILTPEQFRKFMANMEEQKGRWGREGKGSNEGFNKDRKEPGAGKSEGR